MISFKSARQKREERIYKAIIKLDPIQFAGVCKLLGFDLGAVDSKDYELVPGIVMDKISGLSDKALKRLKEIVVDATE